MAADGPQREALLTRKPGETDKPAAKRRRRRSGRGRGRGGADSATEGSGEGGTE
jgi:hypothetical protein